MNWPFVIWLNKKFQGVWVSALMRCIVAWVVGRWWGVEQMHSVPQPQLKPHPLTTYPPPMHHTCAPIHARPGLPVILDPNPTPARQYPLELHYTTALHWKKSYQKLSEELKGIFLPLTLCYSFKLKVNFLHQNSIYQKYVFQKSSIHINFFVETALAN